MAENDKFKITIKGPGLSFDQPVDKAVATKIMSFVMTGSALPDGGGSGAGEGNGSGAAGVSGSSAANRSGLNPKQFLAQKRPGSNYERVACLAYYLSNHRNTPHFRTEDITKLNTESAHHFTNPSLFVQHATSTYHYLASAGGGKKQITPLGEAIVDALPDRAKVTAAIAENKPRRKQAKRKKKAK